MNLATPIRAIRYSRSAIRLRTSPPPSPGKSSTPPPRAAAQIRVRSRSRRRPSTRPSGLAGQAERADTGRTGRARSDTGSHRYQATQPGSAGLSGDTSRLPIPPADPGSRTDRPPARRAHARARRTKRPGRVLLACGLALALVAGAAAYFWLSGRHGSSPAATPGPSARVPRQTPTAPPSPSPSLGPWGHIETRAADPLALTLAELFPSRFSAGGSTYARTVEREGTNCAKAVIGAALQSAVKHAKCSQVMRASYLSGNGKVMGTIGVLNLISVAAAEKSGHAAGGGDFIDQLPAAEGAHPPPDQGHRPGGDRDQGALPGHGLGRVRESARAQDQGTAAGTRGVQQPSHPEHRQPEPGQPPGHREAQGSLTGGPRRRQSRCAGGPGQLS